MLKALPRPHQKFVIHDAFRFRSVRATIMPGENPACVEWVVSCRRVRQGVFAMGVYTPDNPPHTATVEMMAFLVRAYRTICNMEK
jgi:hypothetical protein